MLKSLFLCVLYCFAGVCNIQSKEIKNVVIVKTTQDLLSNIARNDTIFEIEGDIDLDGKTIVFPPNSELLVSTGKITNGILRGDKTKLAVKRRNSLGIRFTGVWNAPEIDDRYFQDGLLSDDEVIANVNNLQSKDVYNYIRLKKNKYSVNIKENNGYVLKLLSHSKCISHSEICLNANSHTGYFVVLIADAIDVKFSGGAIEGDVGTHNYIKGSSSEWGMGVGIIGSSSISVGNVSIKHCIGDGIYIGGYPTNYIGDYSMASKNILLKNIVCDANRRQGLSVISVDGLTVEKCSFINTGKIEKTAPSDGIDIEPNVSDGRNNSVRNVMVKKCLFRDNEGYDLQTDLGVTDGKIGNYDNILVERCVANGQFLIGSPCLTVRNSKMESVIVRPFEAPISIVFEKSKIVGRGVYIKDPHPHKQLYVNKNNPSSFVDLVFNNCRFEYKSNQIVDSEYMISIQSKSKVVNAIALNHCTFILPKNANNDKLIMNKNKDQIVIKNSRKKVGSSVSKVLE